MKITLHTPIYDKRITKDITNFNSVVNFSLLLLNNKKMNKNLKIGFNQRDYDSKVDILSNMAQIYIDAAKELEKLKVKNIKAGSLTKGGFTNVFIEYQTNEFKKSKSAKELDLSFEKFLELKQLDTTKLKKLEQKHENLKTKTLELYEYNDSFFHYAELMHKTNQILKKALKRAPNKKSFKFLDLFSINNNKVKILLPKEPFEVYAFHKEQIQLMHDVNDFVKSSKAIGLCYRDLWPHLEKYLYDDYSTYKTHKTGQHGLSYDLSKIVFSYNKVLTYKI